MVSVAAEVAKKTINAVVIVFISLSFPKRRPGRVAEGRRRGRAGEPDTTPHTPSRQEEPMLPL